MTICKRTTLTASFCKANRLKPWSLTIGICLEECHGIWSRREEGTRRYCGFSRITSFKLKNSPFPCAGNQAKVVEVCMDEQDACDKAH